MNPKPTAVRIAKELYKHLSDCLQDSGFQIWPGHRYLVRPRQCGRDQLFVPVGKAPAKRFYSHVYLGVRIDAVEEVFWRYWPKTDSTFAQETPTIGMEVSHLWDFGMPHAWFMDDFEDVQQIGTEMAAAVVRYGLPYFNKYDSLEIILEALQDDSRYGWMNAGGPHFQFHKALTFAVLLGKDDAYLDHIISAAKVALSRVDSDPLEIERYLSFLRSTNLPSLYG